MAIVTTSPNFGTADLLRNAAVEAVNVNAPGPQGQVTALALVVTLASGSSSGNVIANGAVDDGTAVSGAGFPVLIAGQDGTNVQTFKTDTAGRTEVVTI